MGEVNYQLSADGIRELFKAGLTRREVEVTEAVLAYHTNKRVGDKLFISPKTVKFHLTTVYRKLNIKNRAGLLIHLYPWLERKLDPVNIAQLPGLASG